MELLHKQQTQRLAALQLLRMSRSAQICFVSAASSGTTGSCKTSLVNTQRHGADSITPSLFYIVQLLPTPNPQSAALPTLWSLAAHTSIISVHSHHFRQDDTLH